MILKYLSKVSQIDLKLIKPGNFLTFLLEISLFDHRHIVDTGSVYTLVFTPAFLLLYGVL